MSTRWRAVCAYDGGPFSGWQSQIGGNAIQDVIEARLAAIFKGPIRIHGSGRTDAGVHARGQVFHFDAVWPHGTVRLLAALRSELPPAIQIRSVCRANPDFHARFSVRAKRYVYHVHLGDADPFLRPFCWPVFRPLDFDAMRASAALLRGRHDFRAFTALNGPAREDTVRELTRLEVLRRSRRVRIIAEAPGFLYKMVRSLTGVLVAVGEGKLTPGAVAEMLENGERTPAIQTAPPQGLFLERVWY